MQFSDVEPSVQDRQQQWSNTVAKILIRLEVLLDSKISWNTYTDGYINGEV